jgi:hypothetical protein
MSRIEEIFLNPFARIVFGVIFSGTVASPYLNGYSDSILWAVFGIMIFLLWISSLFVKIQYTKPLIYLIASSFFILCAILYFLYG